MHTSRLTCVEHIMFKTVFNFFNPRRPEPACTRYMQTQTLYQHHNSVVPAPIACRKASRSPCLGNPINQEAIFPLLNHAVYFSAKTFVQPLCRVKPKGRICLLYKWANTAVWLCRGVLYLIGQRPCSYGPTMRHRWSHVSPRVLITLLIWKYTHEYPSNYDVSHSGCSCDFYGTLDANCLINHSITPQGNFW